MTLTTPMMIVAKCAQEAGLTPAHLQGRRQTAEVSRARQKAMWRMRTELGMSYAAIARVLRRSDHTGIMHGVASHARRIQEGADRAVSAEAIRESLQDVARLHGVHSFHISNPAICRPDVVAARRSAVRNVVAMYPHATRAQLERATGLGRGSFYAALRAP